MLPCLRIVATISPFGTEFSQGGPTSIERSQSCKGADVKIEEVQEFDGGICRFH
jgi:hypothetical protein